MTSNIGARDIKNLGQGIGFSQSAVALDYQTMKSTVEDALKRVFNPEFLNRIDDVIVFNPLEKKHIFTIIDLMSAELFGRAEAVGIEISLTESAKTFLVEKGFDPKFGARPLRRAIQRYVEDPMAEAILATELADGDAITITHKEGDKELSFKTKKAKKPAATASGTGTDDSTASPEDSSDAGTPDSPESSSSDDPTEEVS